MGNITSLVPVVKFPNIGLCVDCDRKRELLSDGCCSVCGSSSTMRVPTDPTRRLMYEAAVNSLDCPEDTRRMAASALARGEV